MIRILVLKLLAFLKKVKNEYIYFLNCIINSISNHKYFQ